MMKMSPLFTGLSVAPGKREGSGCTSAFEERQAEELSLRICHNYGHFPSLSAIVKKKKNPVC